MVLRDDGFEDWYPLNQLILAENEFGVDYTVNKDRKPKALQKDGVVSKDQLEIDLHFLQFGRTRKKFQ